MVIHHAFLTVPALAVAYFPGEAKPDVGSFAWWFTYTPLHLVWMGTEAVAVFFILSGIVLVLPVLRSDRFDWVAYYPRRIIRLYGPVLVAIVFALITMLIVRRYEDAAFSAWMNDLPHMYSSRGLLKDATLVTGTSGALSPLWSLQWEVLFSLLLPVYVWFAVRTRRVAWLASIVIIGLIALGAALDVFALRALPIFAVGALVITGWGRLADLAARMSTRRWFWPVVMIVALLLVSVRWEVGALGGPTFPADQFEPVSVVGATLIVIAAAFWGGFRALLESRVVQYLGRVSFSLYLVHEPIIISLRTVLVEWSPWAAMLVSIPLSFVVAHFFMRVVEMSFHRLAQRVGRAVADRRA